MTDLSKVIKELEALGIHDIKEASLPVVHRKINILCWMTPQKTPFGGIPMQRKMITNQ